MDQYHQSVVAVSLQLAVLLNGVKSVMDCPLLPQTELDIECDLFWDLTVPTLSCRVGGKDIQYFDCSKMATLVCMYVFQTCIEGHIIYLKGTRYTLSSVSGWWWSLGKLQGY